MKLSEVKTTIFEDSIPCRVYKDARFYLFNTRIKPFRNIVSTKNVNMVHLFVDENYNITGGQVCLYDTELGLRVEYLKEEVTK